MSGPPLPLGPIAYLGPKGTFSEEALLSEADLASAELLACPTISEAVAALGRGDARLALVPIENAIEGSVNETLDALVFGEDLVIQREVLLDIHLDLLGVGGTDLEKVTRVISYPHATAQCRNFLAEHLPDATVGATNSTAEAARLVAEASDPAVVALAPPLAARLYGLEVLAHAVEDRAGNQTRFFLVGTGAVAPPSGHDRTMVVCFQASNRPGSLHELLGQFAARSIDLSGIHSRPTKRQLGDYCFVIEIEGHVADELIGDCLRELHASLPAVKFLGSYAVPGPAASAQRLAVEGRRGLALDWLDSIRSRIAPGPKGAEQP